VAGVDGRRPLPKFARRTFRQWFAGHPPADGDPVVLFVDTFTDYYSPQVGQAAVRLLEHAGYSVRTPSTSLCCGLTWISTGQLDGARRQLRRSATTLDGLLTDGAVVVGLEPSCTAVWRTDAADLLPDDRHVRHVAAKIRTLAEVLTAAAGWRSPDLTGVRGLAQPHCHQRAVLGWDADRNLLTDAGAEVTAVGGCCGLAGNFGVERGHYDVSVAVAEIALLPAVRRAAHDVVLLADGFSCRTQLEHLAGAHSRHLAELLADNLDGNRS
jgi:Fe-S oxidoreductase